MHHKKKMEVLWFRGLLNKEGSGFRVALVSPLGISIGIYCRKTINCGTDWIGLKIFSSATSVQLRNLSSSDCSLTLNAEP